MNILILLAGPDDIFTEAGYTFPKNLVEINGLPLIQRLIESLGVLKKEAFRPIFILRRNENQKHYTGKVIQLLLSKPILFEVEETAGAACSALYATAEIDNSAPLLIVNGDQILDIEIEEVIQDFEVRELDVGVITFNAVHPRWSFVRCDESGLVVEAAEKHPISDLATVGVYYFRHGSDFVYAAQSMIKKNVYVNSKFYITPSLNELILKGKKIGHYKIPREKYIPLKTPQNIRNYEEILRSR